MRLHITLSARDFDAAGRLHPCLHSSRPGEPWAQRYKLVVQVVVGEQRGEGCRVSARCFWDQQADGWAQESFSNVSIARLGLRSKAEQRGNRVLLAQRVLLRPRHTCAWPDNNQTFQQATATPPNHRFDDGAGKYILRVRSIWMLPVLNKLE